ncbi:adenosylmethionine--8-amino-7-oxononanoate transaminase [Desulfovibrio sp. DV]|uniref:adenosylmethionine--8-amino-7-oxononanoate transaminase n=1 Tax=Desulfovibrio sp. DV TaxID=1844708 RepID=UPI0020C94155|nr:adenosylmethionine--8-amino-7-oxononanoate transaminase [Desulfovibrio sp. DV]
MSHVVGKEAMRIWHPCTQMKDHENHPPVFIDRGQGIYLYDREGRAYIDAISSWWVNLFGHANPRITRAVGEQLARLEHVIFAGCTHGPAEELATRLLAVVPDGLTRVFFADNGSCAVEAALKMSHASWRNLGHPEKCRFIYLTNGYHGETAGALGVCGDALYAAPFAPLVVPQIEVAGPVCHACPCGKTRETCQAECFGPMQAAIEANAEVLSGVIIEPLVQCAGNFHMHPPAYLARLRQATAAAGCHLIADEIAVGFGRTGTMFACEQAGVSPDFMCLSKGITSGTLPLSCVLTTDAVFDAFYHDYAEDKAFLHSHSYTGNPLACAAACETLRIFEEDDVIAANKPKIAHLQAAVRERFAGHRHVSDIRSTGWITAVSLAADPQAGTAFDWRERTGFRIYREAIKRGAWLRNLGDMIYFMPPYVITLEEIDKLADIAFDAVEAVLG